MHCSLGDRALWRAASEIHRCLAERQATAGLVCWPEEEWAAVARLTRQVRRTHARGWHAAAGRLLAELLPAADRLHRQTAEAVLALRQDAAGRRQEGEAGLRQELLALGREFDQVELDLPRHALSVVVGPITLEAVALGPFEVRLDWRALGGPCAYRVLPREPHPAASNPAVSHPHVLDGRLCEGDAAAAIRAALAQGRLLDFFLVAAAVLGSYSPGRSFVPLDRWSDLLCLDCGGLEAPDRVRTCGRCGRTLCGRCGAACPSCGSLSCGDCLAACAGCGTPCCRSCLGACSSCRQLACPRCLAEGPCLACRNAVSLAGLAPLAGRGR